MKTSNKQNLKDYLAFMLNMNADIYGYCVDYNAPWTAHKKNIRDIFEFECIPPWKQLTKAQVKTLFLEWLNDLNCLINVIENLDYSDNYKLEDFTPKALHNKGEEVMLDYINNQIFSLIYA